MALWWDAWFLMHMRSPPEEPLLACVRCYVMQSEVWGKPRQHRQETYCSYTALQCLNTKHWPLSQRPTPHSTIAPSGSRTVPPLGQVIFNRHKYLKAKAKYVWRQCECSVLDIDKTVDMTVHCSPQCSHTVGWWWWPWCWSWCYWAVTWGHAGIRPQQWSSTVTLVNIVRIIIDVGTGAPVDTMIVSAATQ